MAEQLSSTSVCVQKVTTAEFCRTDNSESCNSRKRFHLLIHWHTLPHSTCFQILTQ